MFSINTGQVDRWWIDRLGLDEEISLRETRPLHSSPPVWDQEGTARQNQLTCSGAKMQQTSAYRDSNYNDINRLSFPLLADSVELTEDVDTFTHFDSWVEKNIEKCKCLTAITGWSLPDFNYKYKCPFYTLKNGVVDVGPADIHRRKFGGTEEQRQPTWEEWDDVVEATLRCGESRRRRG